MLVTVYVVELKRWAITVPAFIELSFMYVCVYDRSLDKK